MARPDTDDGWIKLAHELQAAIALADFPKFEAIIVSDVFAQQFGPARRKVAVVQPGVLAREGGWDRSNLSNALRRLVEAGVLERAGTSGRSPAVRFRKDYTAWTRGAGPRFTPRELIWIAQAPARAMQYHAEGPPDIPRDPPKPPPADVVYPNNMAPDVVQPDNIDVVYPNNNLLSIQTTSTLQVRREEREALRCARPHVVPIDNITPVHHPGGEDFAAAEALVRGAVDRDPALERLVLVMAEKRRADLSGELDAAVGGGWQYAVGKFLGDAGTRLRACGDPMRQWAWIRKIALSSTEDEIKAERARPARRPPPAPGSPPKPGGSARELMARRRARQAALGISDPDGAPPDPRDPGPSPQDTRQIAQDGPGRDPGDGVDRIPIPERRSLLAQRRTSGPNGKPGEAHHG